MAADNRRWVLPRSRALWIPAHTPHDVLAGGPTRFVSLYFDPQTCPVCFTAPTVIDTSGLLGHLLDHLTGPLEPAERARAEAVLFDLVKPMTTTELRLPEVHDDRVRKMASRLAAQPSDQRTLREWGDVVGASSRTLSRAIRRDTGMTFATWRTQIRIAAALRLLAGGSPVTRVAGDVGYATPSAFVAAFKRVVGSTPGQYFVVGTRPTR